MIVVNLKRTIHSNTRSQDSTRVETFKSQGKLDIGRSSWLVQKLTNEWLQNQIVQLRYDFLISTYPVSNLDLELFLCTQGEDPSFSLRPQAKVYSLLLRTFP